MHTPERGADYMVAFKMFRHIIDGMALLTMIGPSSGEV